jgi:hypothetical protein
MPPAALPPLPVGAPAAGPTGLPTPAPQQPKLSRGEQELSNDAADTELAKDVFGEYVCTSITFGKPHPASNITESASMCSRPLPPPRYPLRDEHFEGIIERGLLSSLQLEGVLYAGQRHSYILPGREERHAFFLGDGAGVGKGRQIAAIIYDNYCRGRRKSFWFSVTVPACRAHAMRMTCEALLPCRCLRVIGELTGCGAYHRDRVTCVWMRSAILRTSAHRESL